jgi:hypothetical protein
LLFFTNALNKEKIMAAMSTALKEFANNGNSKTSTTSGHTTTSPKLVVERRRVPSGNQVVAESEISVIHGTEDADSLPIAERVAMSVKVRFPITGDTTDRDAALVILRDIVAGDEFGAIVASQNYLSEEIA